ncbi:MAG: hypothetical protein MI924_25575 [Chloroflexales bacterium]|nr:hypothetical protein [Chloroflexales bacterium]
MTLLKQTLKQLTPTPVWDAWSYAYWMLTSGLEWHRSAEGWQSARRLCALRDRHKGERCFIIGNGPSLKQMDLSPLRDEYTFGLNRIYLLFPTLGFHTTYLVSINRLVIAQCAAEIAALPMPKFISWDAQGNIAFDSRMIFMRSYGKMLGFSTDPARIVWEGATVTYVALQLAYFMGFRQVILIGVDHNFASTGTPNAVVVSQGDDPNHFAGNYFGRGFRWQLPDLERSEMAYRLAREAFALDGREVLDATVGGKLQVFSKVAYASLF